MNHQEYRSLLPLLVYDDIGSTERREVESHLRSCSECRRELEELTRLRAVLKKGPDMEPSDQLLAEARNELRIALRLERSRKSFWQSMIESIPSFGEFMLRPAFGAVAMTVIGLVAGYFIFSPSEDRVVPHSEAQAEGEHEPLITNLRFIDSDASDGEIEFTYQAVSPLRVKGKISDNRIQKLLTQALLSDQNPGVRLRTVNAFAAQARQQKAPDKEIKAALLIALRSDENPGVRGEALRTLRGFPFDEELKQAFLEVLMRDPNAGLRIAAINSLDSAWTIGKSADPDMLNVLREKMQSDENNYVRIRARSVLQEVKEQ